MQALVWQISKKDKLFLIIESDLDMRPIAEGLFSGAAASAEGIGSLPCRFLALRVNQGAFAFYKERTAFNYLDRSIWLFRT
jgi:hypothetical protein